MNQITYAGIYDQLVPLPDHEPTFYSSVISHGLLSGEPVLVTPSTTGRLAIALATRGFSCTGVDLDPEMTAVARAKRLLLPREIRNRLNLETGDMARQESDQRFGAVIVPERGLLCLDPENRARALAGFARLLRLGGVLVFDLSLRQTAPLFCYRDEFTAPWNSQHRLRVHETVERTPTAGHVIQRLTVQEFNSGSVPVRSEKIILSLHFPDEDEIRDTLKWCGFRALRLFGDSYCRVAEGADDYEIWIAHRL